MRNIKIMFTLQVDCNRYEFTCFCEYLLWVKANEVNDLAVSSQRVEIGKKINIYKPSKERVGACKDYVIGREITTVLKTAVDNAILQLCDSCDFFPGVLIK